MNIMFRKHFHADKEGGYGFGKSGGRTGRSKAHGKRTRDAGYGHGYSSLAGGQDGPSYRTHLFLNPGGACQSCGGAVEEETASAGLPQPPAATPVAPRRSSVTLLKWPRKSSGSASGSLVGGRFDALDTTPAAGQQGQQAAANGAASTSAPASRQVRTTVNASFGQQRRICRVEG